MCGTASGLLELPSRITGAQPRAERVCCVRRQYSRLVISIGGTNYRLCLLDTNAVSEMAKRPEQEFRHFLDWIEHSGALAIPCASPFTIIELRRRPAVYRAFLEIFGAYPFALVRAHDALLQEEIRVYPQSSRVNPILLGFGGSFGGRDQTSLEDALEGFFGAVEGQIEEARWNGAAADIVEGMHSLVATYPPAANSYTPQEISDFVEQAGLQQLIMRRRWFVAELFDRHEPISIGAFPSIKMATFTVFHKFYVDGNRKPRESDAFDVIISSSLPYMDVVITERHQCEVIRQTKRHDPFLATLQPFAIPDFRDGPPT